jgi:hypothetical protein
VSAGGNAAVSGVVFGLAAVLLGQQLGYVDLGSLVPGVELLIEGAVVFGVVFGILGWIIGRRYARRHPAAEKGASDGSAPAAGESAPP